MIKFYIVENSGGEQKLVSSKDRTEAKLVSILSNHIKEDATKSDIVDITSQVVEYCVEEDEGLKVIYEEGIAGLFDISGDTGRPVFIVPSVVDSNTEEDFEKLNGIFDVDKR